MRLSEQVTQAARVGMAIGLIGLGVTSALWGSFAMQWQPVPLFVPIQLSYLSNLLLVVAGVALMIEKARRWAGTLVALIFSLWLIALKIPEAVAISPQITKVTSWIGFLTSMSEVVAMSAGAWMLHGLLSGSRGLSSWSSSWTLARCAFGVACVQFGLSHFAFVDFTANMIPQWIPLHQPLAYITGAGHLCAGLAILAGPLLPKLWRLAALLEAAMMTSFVLLVHIPMILTAKPDSTQLNWTLLFIATLLASSGAAIAASACKQLEETANS